jgi:hypothetical protein
MWGAFTQAMEAPFRQSYSQHKGEVIHISMAGVEKAYDSLYLARLGILFVLRLAYTKGSFHFS